MTHQTHAAMIAKSVLSSQPWLVGEVSNWMESGDATEAVKVSVNALEKFFADDPFLLEDSLVLKPVAFAWLRRQHRTIPTRRTFARAVRSRIAMLFGF